MNLSNVSDISNIELIDLAGHWTMLQKFVVQSI